MIEDLDAVAAKKLPEHVLDRGREERERQAAERAQDREDVAWYEEQLAALEPMSAKQHRSVLAEASERFESYDPRRWQLEQQIERLAAEEPSGGGEGGQAA